MDGAAARPASVPSTASGAISRTGELKDSPARRAERDAHGQLTGSLASTRQSERRDVHACESREKHGDDECIAKPAPRCDGHAVRDRGFDDDLPRWGSVIAIRNEVLFQRDRLETTPHVFNRSVCRHAREHAHRAFIAIGVLVRPGCEREQEIRRAAHDRIDKIRRQDADNLEPR